MPCPFAFHYHDDLPPRISNWYLTKETEGWPLVIAFFCYFWLPMEPYPPISVLFWLATTTAHSKNSTMFLQRGEGLIIFCLNQLRFYIIAQNLAWANWYSRTPMGEVHKFVLLKAHNKFTDKTTEFLKGWGACPQTGTYLLKAQSEGNIYFPGYLHLFLTLRQKPLINGAAFLFPTKNPASWCVKNNSLAL